MKVIVDKQRVEIVAAGMELVKIKSMVSRCVGDAVFTTKSVSFPLASLLCVNDALGAGFHELSGVKEVMAGFESHRAAREAVLSNIFAGSVTGVTDRWLSILDLAQASAVSGMIADGISGMCLFDEQGSGKTVMAIAAFDLLAGAGKIDRAIVVCPKSMLSEWPKDFTRFTSGMYKVVVAGGDRRQRFEVATSEFDVLVISYESVDGLLSVLNGAAGAKRYLLVVDESYYVKNSDAVRSKGVGALRSHCHRCFVLCGTPAPNSAHDLINQVDLADRGYAFCGFRKSKNPADDWEKIAEIVENRGLFVRRLKDEIFERVPRKNFQVIQVPLSGRQAQMYEIARSELELQLRTFTNQVFKKNLASYFQRRSALLQICACPSGVDPMFSDTPAKYAALDSLLGRLTSENRKVVVWSFYTRSIDEVMDRYARYNPVRLDGSVQGVAARQEAVRSFQEDESVMLFVGNPAAAGAGITLHAAHDAVYLSYSNQAAHYLQSLDRVHRRGQVADSVNYYLVVCQNTIEEVELRRLRNKEVRQHAILGDHVVWPTSLDEALAELVGDG